MRKVLEQLTCLTVHLFLAAGRKTVYLGYSFKPILFKDGHFKHKKERMNSSTYKVQNEDCFLWKCNFLYINFLFPVDICMESFSFTALNTGIHVSEGIF